MNDIQTEVATRLSSLSKVVYDELVNNLVTAETTRRVDAVTTVFNKAAGLKKDLQKINRPDQQLFTADGTVASEAYSKSRLEEIKKLNEQIGKLDQALAAAFDKNDFSKVLELAKNAGPVKGSSAAAE